MQPSDILLKKTKRQTKQKNSNKVNKTLVGILQGREKETGRESQPIRRKQSPRNFKYIDGWEIFFFKLKNNHIFDCLTKATRDAEVSAQ